MSGSEPAGPAQPSRGQLVVRRLTYIAKRSWSTLRQSRLGMIGFAIVVLFALIAILAPFIAPYPRTYLAPDADRFKVNSYSYALPANLTYSGPVLGPTTPLNDAVGSMWDINWNASRGIVYMNLLRYALGFNESPFLATRNLSISFDVTQTFRVSPTPGLPLHAVYYLVPAKDYAINGTTGPNSRNGAVAFFTGNDFVAADPFNNTAFFNWHLDFTPTWTGQDPASAGNMLIAPLQNTVSIGPISSPVGPYEYFYASDGNHTAIFEVQYVHAGYCPCAPPFGSPPFFANGSLSAPPFIYYNQYKVTSGNSWRSGAGQGVFLPLANHTLEVLDVSGTVRAYVPLKLDGAPATVEGNIGYVQTQFPLRLLLPLKSANGTGVAFLDLNTLTLTHDYVLHDANLEVAGSPVSRSGNATYLAFFNPANDTTFIVGVTEQGLPVSSGQLQVYMHGRIRNMFYADEPHLLFVLAADGRIFILTTVFKSSDRVVPDLFTVVPPAGVPFIRYGGAFGGTLYGTLLSNQELNGIWTNPTTGLTTVFQLTGTPRTPLPPGTYSSGSPYYWGTDFFGGDILTEWIYGTQVAFVVGLLAALFSVGIGTLVGVISGYYGKVIDTLLMRTTDVFLVLPFLPIVLVLISITAPSIWIIIMVIAILGWPGIARVIRAQVLSLKERPFVDAARVSGASDLRLVFLHIAPNVLPFSFLYMSLSVGGAIITEAALSFLGFGDPTVTSWGGMLSNLLTFSGGLYAYWWLLPPGLGITFLSLGFYLIGRGFDEIINPRLRRR